MASQNSVRKRPPEFVAFISAISWFLWVIISWQPFQYVDPRNKMEGCKKNDLVYRLFVKARDGSKSYKFKMITGIIGDCIQSVGNCFCKTVELYKNQTDDPLPDNFPPDALGVYGFEKEKRSGELTYKNGEHGVTLFKSDFVIIFILLYFDTN